MQTFGAYLKELLQAKNVGQNEFAAKAGISSGFISLMINDKRTPPMNDVTKWADLLKLKNKEKQRFIELAAIAHLPVDIQPHFISIINRIEKLEAAVKDKDFN